MKGLTGGSCITAEGYFIFAAGATLVANIDDSRLKPLQQIRINSTKQDFLCVLCVSAVKTMLAVDVRNAGRLLHHQVS
jgi:acyl CoA:acetate/3-ketoacid CoA transferase alpha subunit